MPRGDGTGPLGMGPRTGRAAGFCSGFALPGFLNPGGVYGMGFGRGRGGYGGRGLYCHPFLGGAYLNVPAKEEKELLSEQAAYLERQLGRVKRRLNELGEDTE